MLPGERFRNWVDENAVAWADRLGRWTGTAIGAGFDAFAKILGKSAAPKLRPLIDKIEASGEVPPELQPLIDEMKDPTGEYAAVFSNAIGGSVAGGAIGNILDALLRPLGYWSNRTAQNLMPNIAQIMMFWLRGHVKEEDLEYFVTSQGFPKGMVEYFKDLSMVRLDPTTLIKAWYKDKETYESYFKDLRDQGWSDDRIDVLKFSTLFYPPPADLINWQAKEVFEPGMISKYGLDDEFGAIEKEPFYKAGMDDDQILNYWRAHWEHASWNQVVEMLRRGQLTEDDVWDWFRLVEIPPFWREKLINISWEVPTRVDVRRFWDMRTIDEARLREIYTAQGYHGKDLDDYVLWTKVYTAYPDLIARWSKGWLTLDEVKSQLTDMGMAADRVEEMIQTKIQAAEPERTANERDLTKTDIYKGIKADRITRDQGIDLLMDLGFDEDEADLLVATNVPEDITDKVVAQRELTKADILKGLKTAVITRDQARDRLLDLRYSPADAEFLLKIFDAQVKPPEEPAGREASKADIVAAVKKGLITPEDAYLMLQDINFTPEASEFILAVTAEVSPFSPINYAEFKNRTQKYRRAAGMERGEMPEEIKTAAAEVVRLTGDVEALTRSIEEEQRGLVGKEILPEAATKRLKSLQVKRNRAIATLEKAKSDYDRLVAEWRH